MEDFFGDLEDRWPVGERRYHWQVLFPVGVLAERLYNPYRELVHTDGLVPVQPADYHVTVHQGGSLLPSAPTFVSEAEMGAITDLVRAECASIAPFTMLVDRPQAGHGALECPLRPGEPARRLWAAAWQASELLVGERVPLIPTVYWPHLSIAYAIEGVDDRPLKAWMADCDAEPFSLPVERIALVTQQHNRREITWDLLEEIPLTGMNSASRQRTAPCAADTPITLQCPVECLRAVVSGRALNPLAREVSTVGDVVERCRRGELTETRGLGRRGAAEIEVSLISAGFVIDRHHAHAPSPAAPMSQQQAP